MDKIFKKINYFPLHHFEDIQNYLNKMANRGMFLIDFQKGNWHFKKSEPKNIKYIINYSEENLEINSKLTENNEDFYPYNNDKTWQLIAINSKIQIFANNEKEPEKFSEDTMEKFENNKNILDKIFLKPNIISIIGFFILMAMQIYSFLILAGAETRVVIIMVLVAILINNFHSLYNIKDYLSWVKKSKKSIENGGGFVSNIHENTFIINAIMIGIYGLLFVIMLVSCAEQYLFIMVIWEIILILIGFFKLNDFLLEYEFAKLGRIAICFMYIMFTVSVASMLVAMALV